MPVLVDPKGSDFARYRGATLLTPNLSEFEAVVGPHTRMTRYCRTRQALREALDIDALLITLGERGMAVITADEEAMFLPARARQVFDVTGAGDTVIATLAAGLGAGQTLHDAAALANLAAGLVVGKIGVAASRPPSCDWRCTSMARAGAACSSAAKRGRLQPRRVRAASASS